MDTQTLKQQLPHSWKVAIPAFLVMVLIGVGFLQFPDGISVTIQNTGQKTIESVVLHVTGNSYSLEDLQPGASTTTKVVPTGESHLEIEFVDSNGPRQVNAGGYFEAGSRGTIRITIQDGIIDRNDHQISIY